MKKLLLPLILLLLGVGGGVGAGIFLMPPAPEEVVMTSPCGDVPADAMGSEGEADAMSAEGPDAPAEEGEMRDAAGGSTGFEYVKMNNQFIVPVVQDGAVSSMVVLSISVEVTLGSQAAVFTYEPKMRDVFLQVLFDHANVGGFEGTFTSSENMRTLRRALRLAAQEAVGEQVNDVLITDIVRQDL